MNLKHCFTCVKGHDHKCNECDKQKYNFEHYEPDYKRLSEILISTLEDLEIRHMKTLEFIKHTIKDYKDVV